MKKYRVFNDDTGQQLIRLIGGGFKWVTTPEGDFEDTFYVDEIERFFSGYRWEDA